MRTSASMRARNRTAASDESAGTDAALRAWLYTSTGVFVDEGLDHLQRAQRVRCGGCSGNERVRLAREDFLGDRATGFRISGGEIVSHVRGEIVVGGALHDQHRRLRDRFTASQD